MKYLAILFFLVSCGPRVGECYKKERLFGTVSKVREVLDHGVVMKNKHSGNEFYRTFGTLKFEYSQVDCVTENIEDVQ